MSSADELRAAEAKLRTLAGAATPGPWCFYGDDLWVGEVDVLEAFDASPEPGPWPYEDRRWPGHLFHGDVVRPEDAAYIAALPPEVALAVADWLGAAAQAWGRMPAPMGDSPAHRVARAINSAAASTKETIQP